MSTNQSSSKSVSLLNSSERPSPTRNNGKTKKYILQFLIICVVAAPIAYLLTSLFVSSIETLNNEQNQKRVVGYYTVWEEKKLTMDQLKKLTHIIFMFADVQEDGSVNIHDSHAVKRIWDMKEIISMARKQGMKVMIAVGGHLTSIRFPPTLEDPVKKKNLMESIANLFEEYDIDGIEIFWMWPTEEDKVKHLKLVREVRQQLTSMKESKGKTKDYVLSVITSRYSHFRENIYYNEIMKHVDFVNVLTHDWRFMREYVGPLAPLYGGRKDSIDDAMKYLTCFTKQPSKLNLGIPLFGIFWTNTTFPIDDTKQRLCVPKTGEKIAYEVRWRDRSSNRWKNVQTSWHNISRTPYIWKSDEKMFSSFENERSLKEKVDYARINNIGGVVIYAIDQDEDNKLMSAITSVRLESGDDVNDIKYHCE
ncbi:hypothetical protein GCK72_019915 [Caenorhabditis remanei]|uniref:GH18 domain-containing protein n=1 Tax=Caenorhabditis remanei TaxID=31234 RepID=A0A6A5GG24_CAERE|nr:hypothetical protein GCK72_019915 [Caenorhabditis remanei]KAF1753359.1 hypothetical protein GCK72_019915 [Caenorhabditis remanei]